MRTAIAIVGFLGCLVVTGEGECQSSRRDSSRSSKSPSALSVPRDEGGTFPALLSETGAFVDTRRLIPAKTLMPYEVNVPFWTGGASKRRWIALPRQEDGKSGRIRFAPTGEWSFPSGTVFVKHFEAAIDEARPERKRRLETRVLVRDSSDGVFGVTYKWRPDELDADIVTEGSLETIKFESADGMRTKKWYYPSSKDCKTCHTSASGGVLGVNTRQLNCRIDDPSGIAENQLLLWRKKGLFEPAFEEEDLPRFARLARLDNPKRSLEDRVRSFIDVNCANCHRPGGAAADFDGRYDTPLVRQMLLDVPARINFGIDRARFIAPNDVWRSMVLLRIETLDGSKMPPLGHEEVDLLAVATLKEWIRSLPGQAVVAPPSIFPRGGDYDKPVRVTLKHDDPLAIVRYTLDGGAPGRGSMIYREPLELPRSTTVRARAFKDGASRSIPVQETFIIGH